MRRLLAVAFALCLASAFAAAQQQKAARPSPPASASCKFADGKMVKVDYSSPRMKGRKIFGDVVPFDRVWRTGANEATTFLPDTVIEVDGHSVPAGAYTLFTLPTAGEWQLIISKQVGEWGTEYDAKQDLVRTSLRKSALPAPVENFTISFDVASGTTCRMNIDWESTRVSVKIDETK